MSISSRLLMPATLAVLLVTPVISMAKDVCISGGSGGIAVLRKFQTPAPGHCTPISGNLIGGFGVLAGSACTRSDGEQLQILYVAQNDFLDSFQVLVTLPLPSLSGGSLTNKVNFDTNGSSSGGISAAVCKGTPVD